MGDWKLVDSMIVDGLLDVYNKYHMGITAENVAKNMKSVAKNRTCSRFTRSRSRRGAGGRPLQGRDRAVQYAQKKGDPNYLRSNEFINKKTNAEAQRACARIRQGRHGTAGNGIGPERRRAGVVLMTAQNAAQLELSRCAHREVRDCRARSEHHGYGTRAGVKEGVAARRLEADSWVPPLTIQPSLLTAQACAAHEWLPLVTSRSISIRLPPARCNPSLTPARVPYP